MAELIKARVLKIDDCHPVEWNPNEEDLSTFNNLVESIEKDGFLEPITVIPNDGGGYDIVSGEHRWKAAKLAGLKKIQAVVKEDWSEDEAKKASIRMNVTKGKFNPEKFAELWSDLLKRTDAATLSKDIGMGHKEKELDRLISKVGKSLPKSMRDSLNERREEIRNVDDLAMVVQSLYAQYGSTVDSSYMFLTFGGKVHIMITLDKDTRKLLQKTLTKMRADKKDANVLISAALEKVLADLES